MSDASTATIDNTPSATPALNWTPDNTPTANSDQDSSSEAESDDSDWNERNFFGEAELLRKERKGEFDGFGEGKSATAQNTSDGGVLNFSASFSSSLEAELDTRFSGELEQEEDGLMVIGGSDDEGSWGDMAEVDSSFSYSDSSTTDTTRSKPSIRRRLDTQPLTLSDTQSPPPLSTRVRSNAFDACIGVPSQLLQNFNIQDTLGAGAYGKVVKAQNVIDDISYAIKGIKCTAHSLDRKKAEVRALSRMNHRHIVRYTQAWREDFTPELRSYFGDLEGESEDYPSTLADAGVGDYTHILLIQMELCDVTLKDVIEGRWSKFVEAGLLAPEAMQVDQDDAAIGQTIDWCFSKPLIRQMIFRQLLEGVSAIHRGGFNHRDLKPANVFIKFDVDSNHGFYVKIGDLGLASLRDDSMRHLGSPEQGTAMYMAPEIMNRNLKGRSKADYKGADIYSLGVIGLQLFGQFQSKMEFAVAVQKASSEGVLPDNVPADEGGVIREMLKRDPNTRLSDDLLASLVYQYIDLRREEQQQHREFDHGVDPSPRYRRGQSGGSWFSGGESDSGGESSGSWFSWTEGEGDHTNERLRNAYSGAGAYPTEGSPLTATRKQVGHSETSTAKQQGVRDLLTLEGDAVLRNVRGAEHNVRAADLVFRLLAQQLSPHNATPPAPTTPDAATRLRMHIEAQRLGVVPGGRQRRRHSKRSTKKQKGSRKGGGKD